MHATRVHAAGTAVAASGVLLRWLSRARRVSAFAERARLVRIKRSIECAASIVLAREQTLVVLLRRQRNLAVGT